MSGIANGRIEVAVALLAHKLAPTVVTRPRELMLGLDWLPNFLRFGERGTSKTFRTTLLGRF
jgi:hypothetical protein